MTLSPTPGQAPPVTKGVTYERILDARSEPQNWLTYYGAYDGQRYSPLDQINTENVKRLTPAWVFQCGSVGLHAGKSTYSFEASPIVVDGIMFVSGWDGWVWAIDARTGSELWRYKHAIPYDVSLCCGNVNRGVAVAEGMVFVVTLNAHIIALDAETGKKVWDQTYGDVRAGESATVAPLVVKDMVIVGSSGGEFGVRGHADAFKRETGERVWRTYMVPKPGEPGSETWPADGEAWARGGANCWVTSTFDPELNLLYFGTGNPCPDFDGGVREGDNLYTDSGVAVDVDTGEIRAHFQYTPHDLWDYDSTMEHILFDLDGQKLAAHFDKNGFLYILDRTNMEPVRVAPFVDRIDWGEVDEKGNVTREGLPRQGGRPGPLLARPGRRQGMDARRLQPEDRAPLRPGAGRRRDGHAAAPGVQGEHPVLGRGRRRGPRGHGRVHQRLRPADGRREVALAQRHPDVLVGAGHGRRPRVRRRADGRVQRARRPHRRAAVAVPVRQRPPPQPVQLQHRRPAVHRRADRLGRLDRGVPARDARARARAARCSSSRCRRSEQQACT